MRRLAPRSAALSIARGVFQGAFFGVIAGTTLAGPLGLPAWLVPPLAPVGALAIGGFAVARYYRFRYEIEGDTLRVESGVFARQSREIPLGRIQNVDSTQGVLNRLLGLSVVAIETAGGSATEATLDAVDPAEADRLRRLVQRYGERDEATESESDIGEADERLAAGEDSESGEHRERSAEQLFAFGLRDLLTYALVSVRPAALVFLVAGLPLGINVVRRVVRFNLGLLGSDAPGAVAALDTLGPPRLVGLAALLALQITVAAVGVSIVLTIVEYHGFTLVREGDDLRYQRGLVRRYSGTIPLSKVQTVTVRENVLMRRFGFATLVVETAGYSGGSQQSTQGVAVPMAPRETVYDLARDIEPFETVSLQRPPKRARRRYAARFAIIAGVLTAAAYAVDTFLLSSGYWWLALGLFAVVPPAAHLRWRHRGYALAADVFVTRSGFWRRTTSVVPYYRIQTVFVGRSPFQRRRRLASLTADTASSASLLGGSATAHDIDEEAASELRDTLRERLYSDLLARKSDSASAHE